MSSKLLREVTEIAADISEKLEEGGDALMDLLPVVKTIKIACV